MRIVKEYCCCAIPLFNAGIYLTLLTNLILGITAGTLSVATPSIVGAATPSFTKWIFAIVCYVAAGIQAIGFFGVVKEKSIMFRRYTTLHGLVLVGVFAVAAVWIGWSGGKHNTAQTRCEQQFFSNSTAGSASSPVNTTSEGKLLCNIFAWVTFGVMVGLWVVLGIFEFYLYLVISGYGSGQRDDHAQYFSIYSVNDGPMADDMLLGNRSGRNSPDGLGHVRSDSSGTEKGYRDYEKTEYLGTSTHPVRSNTMQSAHWQAAGDAYLSQLPTTHTQEPGPTPVYGAYNQSYVPYPASQPHPG